MNVKEYLNLIKAFFKTHAQINTVKSGNQFYFNAMSKIVYPISHIEYLGQLTSPGKIVFNFLVTLADIQDPNQEDSEEDIYSDTAEIANDAIAYFGNQIGVDYTLLESANIEKFNNGLKDRVCGSTFILAFQEDRLAQDCAIPVKPTNEPV
jgi:hypothetical protein